MQEALKVFKSGTRFLEPAVYEQYLSNSIVFASSPDYSSDIGVVKDYSRYASTKWAFLARFMVQHESSMLNHLSPTTPPAHIIDPYRFVMPRVIGRPLNTNEDEKVLIQLEEKVSHMHSKKVVHNDLHASNILVTPDTVVILDVMSAMYSPVFWILFPLRNRDWANVAKIKQRVCPNALTDLDRKRLKKPLWVRSLQKLWYQIYRPARLKALRGVPNKK